QFPALSFFQFVVPLILAATSLIPALKTGHRPARVLTIALAVTACAGAFAMRNGIWLSIAAGLLIAEAVTTWLPTQAPRPSFVAGRLAARSGESYLAAAPVNAIEATATYAAAHPLARALADNTSATALLWLHPELQGRVGFDAELDAYPPQALMRWLQFQAAE